MIWLARHRYNIKTRYDTQNSISIFYLASTTHELLKYPGEFKSCKKDVAFIQKAVSQHFPGLGPATLGSVTDEGIWLVPSPASKDSNPNQPPYLAMHMNRVIGTDGQQQLLERRKELNTLGPVHLLKRNSRLQTSALHLGVWSLYTTRPRVTRESEAQSPEVIKAMDKLLNGIKKWVVPKLINILKDYCPQQLKQQEK
jgi:hypothetical protein